MRDADSFFLAGLKDTQRMKTPSCVGSQRQKGREKTARIAEQPTQKEINKRNRQITIKVVPPPSLVVS